MLSTGFTKMLLYIAEPTTIPDTDNGNVLKRAADIQALNFVIQFILDSKEQYFSKKIKFLFLNC